MTEAAPDIPPWSPLADRARQLDVDGTSTGTVEPLPDGDGRPPGGPGPTPRRSLPPGALVAVLLLAVLALVAAVGMFGGSEPVPSTTTLSVRDPLPESSVEQPAPLGSQVALGNGWTASVRGADLRATSRLARTNRSDPIEDDERYVLVDLELSYLDGRAPSESPFYGVDLGVVGEDGSLVTSAEARCRVPGDALDVDTELPRGSSVRGLVCFAVPADQLDSLVLVAEPSMTVGSTPSYLALRWRS